MKKILLVLGLCLGLPAFATNPPPGGNVGVAVASDGVTVSFLNLDSSGNLKTTGGSGGGGGTSSNFGAAFPAAGTAFGVSNGTNMVALVLGQAVKASSIPVTLASDQGGLAVTGTFWQTTQPVSAAGIPAGLGQLAAAASQPVALANEDVQDLYLTGQSAQTATVNNILTAASGAAATDASGYKAGSVQVVSTGTGGTFIFEGSNDNVNFQSVPVYNQLVLTGTPITGAITATASQFIYTFPLQYRYVRLRIASTITGGSIQAFSTFKQSGWSPSTFTVSQGTTANLLANTNEVSINGTAVVTAGVAGIQAIGGNIANGVAPTADPVLTAGITLSTVPGAAIANGLTQRFSFTGDQQLIVHQNGDPANEWQVTTGTTPLTATTSTALKAAGGAGIRNYLKSLQLTNGAAVAGTVSILDGASVIATFNIPAAAATTLAGGGPWTFTFEPALKGTAATAMNIQITTASTLSLTYNAQGFQNN